MLIKSFGLFGVLLASAYLTQGVTLVRVVLLALARRQFTTFGVQLTMASLDFLFGVTLLTAGIGLLFRKEWARKTWLILMPGLVLTHFAVITIAEIAQTGIDSSYLIWTVMIVVITALSWWYFMNPAVRPNFSKKP